MVVSRGPLSGSWSACTRPPSAAPLASTTLSNGAFCYFILRQFGTPGSASAWSSALQRILPLNISTSPSFLTKKSETSPVVVRSIVEELLEGRYGEFIRLHQRISLSPSFVQGLLIHLKHPAHKVRHLRNASYRVEHGTQPCGRRWQIRWQ